MVITLWPSGRAAMNSMSGASYSSNDRTLLGSTRLPAAPARSMQETRCPEPWSRHASLNQHQAPWQAPCTRTKCSVALEASPPVSIPIPTANSLCAGCSAWCVLCIYRQGLGSRKCPGIPPAHKDYLQILIDCSKDYIIKATSNIKK